MIVLAKVIVSLVLARRLKINVDWVCEPRAAFDAFRTKAAPRFDHIRIWHYRLAGALALVLDAATLGLVWLL